MPTFDQALEARENETGCAFHEDERMIAEHFYREGRKAGPWILSKDKPHPEAPKDEPDASIPCICMSQGEIVMLQWNCFYHVWDDAEGDDFYCEKQKVTAWFALEPPATEGGEQ